MGLSPTLSGSQGQRVPGSLATLAGISGFSPRRPRKGLPSPQARGSWHRGGGGGAGRGGEPRGGGLDSPPLLAPSRLLTPEYSPRASAGNPFRGCNGARRRGHSRLGRPLRVALFRGYPRRRPFSRLPGEDRVGRLSREKLGGCGPMRGQGRAGGGATTHPASPPPPAGDPGAPEATVAALPSPAAATTNRNLQPRPLAVANAQPDLLTAPPRPLRRANGDAPQPQPGPASVLAYFSQEPMRRARSCSRSRSCSRAPPARLGLGSSKPEPAGSRGKLACARTRAAPPRAPVRRPRRALATCAGWLRGAEPATRAGGEGGRDAEGVWGGDRDWERGGCGGGGLRRPGNPPVTAEKKGNPACNAALPASLRRDTCAGTGVREDWGDRTFAAGNRGTA